jgi:nucleoside-diphosphate-sugar epimerase
MTSGSASSQLVALTGATGFVGGAIARALIRQGYRVRVLARSASRLPTDLDAEVLTGDLLDATVLDALVAGVDSVVHCAGVTRGVTQEQFDVVNVTGTLRLAHRVVARGQVPFLLISSLAARSPQVSAYARSKRGAEDLLRRTPGLQWAAMRAPAVYGPGAKEIVSLVRWMSRGLLFIPGDTESRFSLIHADDLAEAVCAWLSNPEFKGPFEVDDHHDEGYSWMDFHAVAQDVFKRHIRIVRPPGPLLGVAALLSETWGRAWGGSPALTTDKLRQLRFPDWVCDDRRFAEACDWRPAIDLHDGLAAMRERLA